MNQERDIFKLAVHARKRWHVSMANAFNGTYDQQTPAQRQWHRDNMSKHRRELEAIEAEVEAANLPTNRYSISIPADQTILLLCDGTDPEWGSWTTKHPSAKLFNTRDEAESVMAGLGEEHPYVEFVVSEDEFRSREDTW